MHTSMQNINTKQVKSTQELTRLLQEVIACAKKQGATDAEVGVDHDSGYSVNVRMGEVETVEFSDSQSVSVSVYFGHQKGSASSTDTSSKAIESMVRAACDIAQVSAADPCFGLADKDLINNHYPDLDLYHPWDLLPAEAISRAIACEQHALSLDKRITNSDGVNLANYSFCHGFANSNGCEGIVYGTRHSLSCSLIAQALDAMQRDYDYTVARHPRDLLPIEQLARQAVERTVGRLGAKKIKTQKAPVIFSSRLSSGLFSTLINAISGAHLYRKSTFLIDSIGKTIFPSFIKIYEQPFLLGALGSSPFDAEGVPTRNNVFVADGKVNQYVLSSYTARKLGLKTTANSGGVSNLTVDATTGDLAALLKTMGTGLLVTELMGQGINLLNGDYSRGAAGFWVENGEIQFPVEEITIAGNLTDMFMGIEAIGNDLNPNSSTRCGSVLINNMMIAGS